MASPEETNPKQLVLPPPEVDVPGLAASVMAEFQVARSVLELLPVVTLHPRFGRVVAHEAALVVAELQPVVFDTPQPLDLAALVCNASKVEVDDVLGRSRRHDVIQARQLIMTLAIEVGGMSTPQVGKFLDRDHSTVINGHRAVKEKAQKDTRFNDIVERLRSQAEAVTSHASDVKHVVLLSGRGLEKVTPLVLDKDGTQASKLTKGDEVLVRPEEAATPEETYELWEEFGQSAADSLSTALRT